MERVTEMRRQRRLVAVLLLTASLVQLGLGTSEACPRGRHRTRRCCASSCQRVPGCGSVSAAVRNACGYQMTICKSSPIPAGFLIVGQATDFNCSNALDNAWVIQRYNTCEIGQQMTICKGQTVPAGWVITATTTNFNCGNSLDNAWVIKRVN